LESPPLFPPLGPYPYLSGNNTSTLAPTLEPPTPTPINRTRNRVPLALLGRLRTLCHTVFVAHAGPSDGADFAVAEGVPAELGSTGVDGVGVGVCYRGGGDGEGG
ncbi:hypothetical protein T440DRAFT_168983, partial [Plenodomus tracheiphilus IPT5]